MFQFHLPQSSREHHAKYISNQHSVHNPTLNIDILLTMISDRHQKERTISLTFFRLIIHRRSEVCDENLGYTFFTHHNNYVEKKCSRCLKYCKMGTMQ